MSLGQKEKHSLLLMLFGAYLVFIVFFTAITILPLYTVDLGGTQLQAGYHSTIFFLLAVVLRLYFGPLADSKGRKIPLVIGAFVFASSSLLFILCTEVWHLMLVRAYQAIGLAAFLSTASSFVADLAPLKQRGMYIGIYRLVLTLSLLTGPVFAMEIIRRYSYQSWFLLSFIIGIISCLALLVIKNPAITTNDDNSGIIGTLDVLKNTKLRPIFLGLILAAISYGSIFTFASIYVASITANINPGIYFTYFGLSGLIANLLAGYLSDRLGRSVVVWPAIGLLGIGMILLALLPSSYMFFILSGFAAGIGYTGAMAALVAWVIDVADDSIRATTLAIQESTIDLSIAFGSFWFGIISSWVGFAVSFVLVGLSIVLLSSIKMLQVLSKAKSVFENT